MDELDCMRAVDEALRSVEDEAARARIVSWASAKYTPKSSSIGGAAVGTSNQRAPVLATRIDGKLNEIPGIAKLSPTGELQLTVRDLKASSANDAAVRLVHIVIWAATKLTGEPAVSSKHVVLPLLRKYRCYDGNTRKAIAADKGLVRDGDSLSLDFHSEQHAEKIAEQILDTGIEGKWKPTATKRRTSRSIRNAFGAE